MALGASAGRLQWRLLTQTLRLASAGVLLGLVVSWPLGRVVEGLLFGVTPSDPVTFAAIPVVLIAVAALAGYLPVRRASRLDPIETLRAE